MITVIWEGTIFTFMSMIGGDKEGKSASFSVKAKETEALFFRYHYMNIFYQC